MHWLLIIIHGHLIIKHILLFIINQTLFISFRIEIYMLSFSVWLLSKAEECKIKKSEVIDDNIFNIKLKHQIYVRKKTCYVTEALFCNKSFYLRPPKPVSTMVELVCNFDLYSPLCLSVCHWNIFKNSKQDLVIISFKIMALHKVMAST